MTVTMPPPQLKAPPKALLRLTERELSVLCSIAEGMSNEQIGRRLCLAENTIKTHTKNLYVKLGARDRAHAVSLAYRVGILTVEPGSPVQRQVMIAGYVVVTEDRGVHQTAAKAFLERQRLDGIDTRCRRQPPQRTVCAVVPVAS